jgi:hypothetical protein
MLPPKQRLLDQVRDRLRLKNYAYWTEKGIGDGGRASVRRSFVALRTGSRRSGEDGERGRGRGKSRAGNIGGNSDKKGV